MGVWSHLLFCVLVFHTSAVRSTSVRPTTELPTTTTTSGEPTTTTTTTITSTTTTLPKIQGCEYEGKIYPLDSEFRIERCQYVYCGSSGEMITIWECCLFPCARAVYVDDQCCPTCPYGYECEFNNTYIKSGEYFHIEGCDYGYCEMGEIMNVPAPCVEEDSCSDPAKKVCCPDCPSETTSPQTVTEQSLTSLKVPTSPRTVQPTSSPQPGSAIRRKRNATASCEYEGKIYEVNVRFNLTPCKFCRCKDDGEVLCFTISCPRLNCSNYTTPTNECCPVCENTKELQTQTYRPNNVDV